jgi:hypothetical protein
LRKRRGSSRGPPYAIIKAGITRGWKLISLKRPALSLEGITLLLLIIIAIAFVNFHVLLEFSLAGMQE